MTQRIILIHGRNTKPGIRQHKGLQRLALKQGVANVSTAKAAKIGSHVKLDIVYYGDVNNRILKKYPKYAADLSETDPVLGTPCLPSAGYSAAIEELHKIKRYDRRDYRKILANNKDKRWLDEAAAWISTIASLISFSSLNMLAIKAALPDMAEYLCSQAVGSEIRKRLADPLERSLLRGDDICLISHSMGCVVAFDVLWKFSRTSEYEKIQKTGNRVANWITVGSPLGEAGVKKFLKGGSRNGGERYPANIVTDWKNIAARDDFIAHDKTMKDDYRRMKKAKLIKTITDKKIYNCYAKDGVANPHKFYGYLDHPVTAKYIANWIK